MVRNKVDGKDGGKRGTKLLTDPRRGRVKLHDVDVPPVTPVVAACHADSTPRASDLVDTVTRDVVAVCQRTGVADVIAAKVAS